MKKRQVWSLLGVITALCATLTTSPIKASQTISYDNPIAYIGNDGNVYISSLDGTNRTALTTDGSSMDGPMADQSTSSWWRYGGLHWSLDGTQLSFVDTRDLKLYIVRSGKGAEQVPDAKPGHYFWQSAISPDHSQIAYVDDDENVMTIPVTGGKTTKVAVVGDTTFELPETDSAQAIRDSARGYEWTNTAYTLMWTKWGILASCGELCVQLVSPDGKELWHSEISSPESSPLPVISADGTQVIIPRVFNGYDCPHEEDVCVINTIIDLATRKLTKLPIDGAAHVLAWAPNSQSIFFSTSSDQLSVLDPDTASIGAYIENTLSLWQVSVHGGTPTLLFQRRGYDFGAVRLNPTETALVFSLVTSWLPEVQAKLSNSVDDNKAVVEPAHAELIALSLKPSSAPNWIALGGNFALGVGRFDVPDLPPLPQKNPMMPCVQKNDKVLPIGQRVTLTKNNTLTDIHRYGFTSSIDIMPLNKGSIVLVTGGPECSVDGIAWWKVNYQGVVGWISGN